MKNEALSNKKWDHYQILAEAMNQLEGDSPSIKKKSQGRMRRNEAYTDSMPHLQRTSTEKRSRDKSHSRSKSSRYSLSDNRKMGFRKQTI